MKSKNCVNGERQSGLNKLGRTFCGLLTLLAVVHVDAAPTQGAEHSERSASQQSMRANALSIEKAPIVNTTSPHPVAAVAPPNALTVSQDPLINSSARDGAFGLSLAMDGLGLAVGAHRGVHAYKFVDGQWIKEKRLYDANSGYFSVAAISMSGDRIAYGAGGSDQDAELYAGPGSINVYRKIEGNWAREAQIFDRETDGSTYDFGYSVSIDGDNLAAGGISFPYEYPKTTPTVIFYSHATGNWVKTQAIKLNELPGFSGQPSSAPINRLLLKDDFLFISDPRSSSKLIVLAKRQTGWIFDSLIPSVCNTCFAYKDGVLIVDRTVYVRGMNSWLSEAILPQGDGALAFDGRTLTYASGHVYSRVGSSWIQRNAIERTSGAVAISAQGLVRSSAGTAITYRALGDSWSRSQTLVPDYGASPAEFGSSVSMIGDGAVVGAPYDDGLFGAAYVVNRNAESWTVDKKIVPNIRTFYNRFGIRVAISSDYVAVGDEPECYNSGESSSVFLFKRNLSGWVQEARLQEPGGTSYCDHGFGQSFAIFSNLLSVVGNAGTYIYERGGSGWALKTLISPQQIGLSTTSGAQYASEIVGDIVAIGSSGIDSASGRQRSSISFFKIDSTGLKLQQRLDFPKPVKFSLTTNVLATLSDGVVTMYGMTGQLWQQLSVLTEFSGGGAGFISIRAAGGVLAVQLASGTVDLYTRKGNNWYRKAELAAADSLTRRNGYFYPASLAASGERVLVSDQFYSEFANQGGVVRSYTVASDYGDAPDNYKTLRANGGARHFIDGPRLGSLVDADEDGHPSPDANGDDVAGDDDEDGVSFSSVAEGGSASLQVVVSNGPAKIDAWVDFDGDGSFSASERIATGSAVPSGTSQIPFNCPVTTLAPRQARVRVRVSSDGVASPSSTAVDGEVEDHVVTIKKLSLSIADATVFEGNSGTRLMTFEVTANAPPPAASTVNFSTVDGTAVAGTDYISQSGTISFAPGESRKIISVTINGDLNVEADEVFQVKLSNPTGISLFRSIGTGTITNDDSAAGTPGITVNVKRFNFGGVAVGSKSIARSLIVTSSGSAPLEINAIRIAGDYSGTSKCPKLLAPGATCELTGTFVPKARGVRPGSVTLTTNAPSGPTVVELTGTGT